MRTKVTLVLLFLNVALFVFIFKFERGWRTEQAERETRRRVLGPEAASIQRLRISGPGLTTIELQRTGEQWALTAPIDWPANPHAVNRILNELQFLEHETSFSVAELERNNQSLADYGLEQPRLTIEFTPSVPTGTASGTAAAAAERSVTLQVGDETKVGNRLYLLSPERDRVHVVGLSLAHSLNLPLEELRTDNIFTIPIFEARSLNLQNASASRVRIRQEGKHWSFEAPIIARANKPQVELTINALNALRVHHFLPDSDSPVAANADLRVGLIGNNRRQTLILLREIPNEVAGIPAAVPGQEPIHAFIATLEGKAPRFVLPIPESLLNTLRNAQDTLRETRILDFEPEALTAVTLAAPDQAPLTLQQLRSSADGQSTWQVIRRDNQQSPQLQPADPQRMQELIRTLRQLAAQRFVSDAPSDADLENWGFNRPEREITLTLNNPVSALSPAAAVAAANTTSGTSNRDSGADSARTLTLQIGRPTLSEPHLYARLGNARFVYQVPAEILEQTAPDPLLYRSRLLRELPEAARFSALTITDLRENRVVFGFDASVENANAAEPRTEAAAANAKSAEPLFAALRRLEAASLVQDHFSDTVFAAGAERAWRWRIDTTVQLPSGGGGEQSQTHTLLLSERLGGDLQLAGSPELGLVFAVNQNLLDALWQLSYREPTRATRDNSQPASTTDKNDATPAPAPEAPAATPAESRAAADDAAAQNRAAADAATAESAALTVD